MEVEEKSDRWFKEKYGNEGFTDIEEEIRKICFEDGYKECEKEKKECQDFIWESVGFKKRGFVNSIQIADYIEKLEKENAELKARLNAINLLTPELEKRSKLKNQQLTKAKEIILKLYNAGRDVLMCRAEEKAYDNLDNAINDRSIEQFLKEIEK